MCVIPVWSHQKNIKKFIIQNIVKFKGFDLALKHIKPNILTVSNSDNIIRDINFEEMGYKFKENIKQDNSYTSIVIAIYEKI